MPDRRETGRPGSRAAALTAGVCALLLLAVVTTPAEQTEAAWVDRETVSAALSTATIPAPVFGTPCTTEPGLLGVSPSITVQWTIPAGYALASARFAAGTTTTSLQIGASGQTTTALGSGRFRTVFSGGLLSGLLGGQASVGISVVHSSGWTSKWATATGGSALLGASPYCVVNS